METDTIASQQTAQPPQIKRKYKTIFLLVVAVLLVTNIITGLLLFLSSKSRQNRSANQTFSAGTENKLANLSYLEVTEDIENIVQQILSGKIDFPEKINNLQIFTKKFDLTNEKNGYITLDITVYKYFPGAKFNGGYEGITYITNLDTIVNRLSQLKLGKQIGGVLIDEPLYPGSYEIIYKELGKNKYAIYDTTFLGGGVFRHYFSFDAQTKQLLHLVISMNKTKPAPESMQECYDSEGKTCIVVYAYPKELRMVIENVESLFSKN